MSRSIPSDCFQSPPKSIANPDTIPPQRFSTPTALARDEVGTTSKAAGKIFPIKSPLIRPKAPAAMRVAVRVSLLPIRYRHGAHKRRLPTISQCLGRLYRATNSGDGGNTDQMTSPAKGFGSGASTAYEPPAASSMSGSRPRSCHPWQRSRIAPMSASGLRDKSSTMSARDFVPPA